jgi:tetratricopeptide (TPR) repeat protein
LLGGFFGLLTFVFCFRSASINRMRRRSARLRDQGHYQQAFVLLQHCLKRSQTWLGDNHPHTANTLNDLGILSQALGDPERARSYVEQALKIYRRVQGEDHRDTAEIMNNLGYLLQALGDLATARPHLEQALEICRRVQGENHPNTAVCLNNLGLLLQALGDREGARPCYKQALEINRRVLGDHLHTALCLNNLGVLLYALGDLAAARPHLEQALEINRRVLGDDHHETAKNLLNLGCLEVASGRIDEALLLMRKASTIDDHMIGQVFSIGSDRQRLLFLQQLQGNLDCFLSLVSRHLSRWPEAPRMALDLVLRRKLLGAEALAAQREAILGGRYPHLREALHQLTRLRQRIAQKILAGPAPGETLVAHEQTLHKWQQEQQQRETDLARQIPEMNLEQQRQKADLYAVFRSLPEGVTLVEFVCFRVFDFSAVPARGEQRWQTARYLAFVLPAGKPDGMQMIDLGEAEPINQLIADFRAILTVAPQDRPDRDLVRRQAEPASALDADPGSRLRAALFDRLTPALGDRRRLFLAPDGALAWLPFEVLPLEDGRPLIDAYQISYLSCGRDALCLGAASEGPTTDPLVIADPDFELAAAMTADRQAEEVDRSQKKPGWWSRLFGRRQVAAPVASDATAALAVALELPGRHSRELRRGHFHCNRLPGTRVEGERVADLLRVRPWLGAAALEGRLKHACRSPRLLHLATHGFFLPDRRDDPEKDRAGLGLSDWQAGAGPGRLEGPGMENPLLRSGLVLAGVNTWFQGGATPPEAEDGLLTAEDVSGLDLTATELVVLSACQTGLGEVHAGEGVFGLRRAFVLAGAKTLVMSLWKVPDLATALLMERFYENLLSRRRGRAESLHAAQLYTRGVTVGELRSRWLSPELIDRLAAADAGGRKHLQMLAGQPDEHRPFEHPFYWGAFICQGDPAPLSVVPNPVA